MADFYHTDFYHTDFYHTDFYYTDFYQAKTCGLGLLLPTFMWEFIWEILRGLALLGEGVADSLDEAKGETSPSLYKIASSLRSSQ